MKNLNNYITEAWSGVKQQSSIDIEAIEAWCDEMGIRNYTINSKGEIDVDGYVDLEGKRIKELPYKFGKVNGFFDIRDCQGLKSLKNCPNIVIGYFCCYRCTNLNSLEGCPKEVGGNFNCSTCISLDSLEGCPKKVGRYFRCENCKRKFTIEEVTSLCNVKKTNIYV